MATDTLKKIDEAICNDFLGFSPATNATKPATLETGVEIRVPLFINEGELVQVDTRDGSYLQRVKE